MVMVMVQQPSLPFLSRWLMSSPDPHSHLISSRFFTHLIAFSMPHVLRFWFGFVWFGVNFDWSSFQGGFAASGPSQDQVYEAMEIFGEGIQDFDFNANLEDEVRSCAIFGGLFGLVWFGLV